MSLVTHTTRWSIEGEDKLQTLWADDGGIVILAWHSRILMLPVVQTKLRKRWNNTKRRASIMISHSRDGAFVSKSAEMLGLNVIRGSASNKKKTKNKGGLAALIETVRRVEAGDVVCITPDGPRGPREKLGLGAIKIAQRANAPIVVWGVAIAPTRKLNTWDKFNLPGLFGRGVLVFDGPFFPTKDMDSEDLRIQIETRLQDATNRAEILAGLAKEDTDSVNRSAREETPSHTQPD